MPTLIASNNYTYCNTLAIMLPLVIFRTCHGTPYSGDPNQLLLSNAATCTYVVRHIHTKNDAVEAHMYRCSYNDTDREMSLDEQYTTSDILCEQLTKTFRLKRPAIEYYQLCIARQVTFCYHTPKRWAGWLSSKVF